MMEQKDLNNDTIIIKSVELIEGLNRNKEPYKKIKIVSDRNKIYNLWVKKTDGSETKAFSQLKGFGFPLNKRVGIAYEVSEFEKDTPEGKKVLKSKTIKYFTDVDDKFVKDVDADEIPDDLEKANEDASEYSDGIDASELPF
jgi:hypothetical protein